MRPRSDVGGQADRGAQGREPFGHRAAQAGAGSGVTAPAAASAVEEEPPTEADAGDEDEDGGLLGNLPDLSQLTEALAAMPVPVTLGDIAAIEACGPPAPDSGNHNVVRVELGRDVQLDLGRLQRHFYTTSSCGVCGKASLDALHAVGAEPLTGNTTTFQHDMLAQVPHSLRAAQATFDKTGGLHAAAAFTTAGELVVTREDVGRHNAVDKVVGALLLEERLPARDLGLMVSGRASFELLQKALVAGMPLLAAVSAPSSLAVQLAREFDITLIGFLRGDKVIRALRELIGDHQIEDLPISYTAVASDLKRQREVWLKAGSLFDAIRASIAIPTLFTPVRHEGRLLVDGGLVNPVPIAPTIRDNTDVAIAVDASAPEEKNLRHSHRNQPKESSSYRQQIADFLDSLNLLPKSESKEEKAMDTMEILTKSIEVMQSMITRFQLAANSPDILIRIPQNIATFYEFHHAEELIAFGYERTRATFANRQSDQS